MNKVEWGHRTVVGAGGWNSGAAHNNFVAVLVHGYDCHKWRHYTCKLATG